MDGKYTVQDVIKITAQYYKKSFKNLMVAMPSEYTSGGVVEIMDSETSTIIGLGRLVPGNTIVTNEDGWVGVNLLITNLKYGKFERKVITANVTYEEPVDNIDINN